MRGRLAANIAGIASAVRRYLARRRASRARRGSGHRVEQYLDRLVSAAIQFNEIPSPTPREEQRAAFIARRLSELGVSSAQQDKDGNVLARFPGAGPDRETVLLFASMENEDYSPLESLVRLSSERAFGRGMAGNSLGVAALLVLAEYLQASGDGLRPRPRPPVHLPERRRRVGQRAGALPGPPARRAGRRLLRHRHDAGRHSPRPGRHLPPGAARADPGPRSLRQRRLELRRVRAVRHRRPAGGHPLGRGGQHLPERGPSGGRRRLRQLRRRGGDGAGDLRPRHGAPGDLARRGAGHHPQHRQADAGPRSASTPPA